MYKAVKYNHFNMIRSTISKQNDLDKISLLLERDPYSFDFRNFRHQDLSLID